MVNRFPEIQTSVGTNVEGRDNMVIITIRNDECRKSLKDESFFTRLRLTYQMKIISFLQKKWANFWKSTSQKIFISLA